MKTSISDQQGYRTVCKNASENEELFSTFKRNPIYTEILEHVSGHQGQLYLNNIYTNLPNFEVNLERFKKNDLYGGTNLTEYEKIGQISPSTLRYVKVLSDLNMLFGDLTGKKIAEIGVGYGGQCFIINQLFEPSDYVLFDLNEVLKLSDKYLNSLQTKHRIVHFDEISKLDEEFDLVISNYAYSELTKETQDLYFDKVISRSKNGYFTLNFISHIFNVDSYNLEELKSKFGEKNPKLLNEEPSTFENNVILYF
jgi:putative sugar O-methyltransferase